MGQIIPRFRQTLVLRLVNNGRDAPVHNTNVYKRAYRPKENCDARNN
jgi:hypothetical protein